MGIRFIALCCLVYSVTIPCFAEKKFKLTKLSEFRTLLYLGGDLGFPSSEADKRTDVVYGRKFTNPYVGSAAFGFRFWSWLYLGARYEYWLATQDYTLAGTNYINDVRYHALGAEVGWLSGSPRVFWLLSATAFYPLSMSVVQRGGNTYKKTPSSYTFQARAMLGVRFNSRLFLHLNGGYRFANFGNLTANDLPLIPGSKSLDLSGIFAGMGLGLSF